MASRRTWLWIVVGVLGFGIFCLIAVAGAGVYFVSRHIKTERVTNADAIRAFDDVKARFPGAVPLYELDNTEQPRMVHPLTDLPSSNAKPDQLWLLAWDPDDERLVKLSLPFWVLTVGSQKMEVAGRGRDFDLDRLKLDPRELERIGPRLVFDFRDRDGARVLLWTQ
jgi:hypothetical protein